MKFKKYIIYIIIFNMLLLCGCNINSSYTPPEKPVLYYKDIDVVVVANTTNHWYAGIHRYNQTITVKSEEYNLEKTFNYEFSGVFTNMPYWDCKEGDIIKAELYSWVIESTKEVTKREINILK